MCFVSIVRLMRIFYALANKYSRKITEDKRLNSSYQQLEQEHEYSERNGHRHEACTNISIDNREDKYHADKRQDNDMACHDIGKKTYHQCHWLDKQGYDFDKHEHWFHPARNARRIEEVTPEMFLTVCEYHNK